MEAERQKKELDRQRQEADERKRKKTINKYISAVFLFIWGFWLLLHFLGFYSIVDSNWWWAPLIIACSAVMIECEVSVIPILLIIVTFFMHGRYEYEYNRYYQLKSNDELESKLSIADENIGGGDAPIFFNLKKSKQHLLAFIETENLTNLSNYVEVAKAEEYKKLAEERIKEESQALIAKAQTLGDWDDVRNNVPEPYKTYASKKFQELSRTVWKEDHLAFLNASSLATQWAYQKYLQLYPQGDSADVVRRRLDDLRIFEERMNDLIGRNQEIQTMVIKKRMSNK